MHWEIGHLQWGFVYVLMPLEVDFMNHVILIGRLTGTPEIVTTESGTKRTVVTLAVPRTYKNQEGLYDTDFLRCILWNGIAQRTTEYCKKGDVVCVRGRLQVRHYTNENEETKFVTEVIVENIAFVSSSKENKEKNGD